MSEGMVAQRRIIRTSRTVQGVYGEEAPSTRSIVGRQALRLRRHHGGSRKICILHGGEGRGTSLMVEMGLGIDLMAGTGLGIDLTVGTEEGVITLRGTTTLSISFVVPVTHSRISVGGSRGLIAHSVFGHHRPRLLHANCE